MTRNEERLSIPQALTTSIAPMLLITVGLKYIPTIHDALLLLSLKPWIEMWRPLVQSASLFQYFFLWFYGFSIRQALLQRNLRKNKTGLSSLAFVSLTGLPAYLIAYGIQWGLLAITIAFLKQNWHHFSLPQISIKTIWIILSAVLLGIINLASFCYLANVRAASTSGLRTHLTSIPHSRFKLTLKSMALAIFWFLAVALIAMIGEPTSLSESDYLFAGYDIAQYSPKFFFILAVQATSLVAMTVIDNIHFYHSSGEAADSVH